MVKGLKSLAIVKNFRKSLQKIRGRSFQSRVKWVHSRPDLLFVRLSKSPTPSSPDSVYKKIIHDSIYVCCQGRIVFFFCEHEEKGRAGMVSCIVSKWYSWCNAHILCKSLAKYFIFTAESSQCLENDKCWIFTGIYLHSNEMHINSIWVLVLHVVKPPVKVAR